MKTFIFCSVQARIIIGNGLGYSLKGEVLRQELKFRRRLVCDNMLYMWLSGYREGMATGWKKRVSWLVA